MKVKSKRIRSKQAARRSLVPRRVVRRARRVLEREAAKAMVRDMVGGPGGDWVE